ncbi:MAG: histidinol-phosphate transaminase [Rikenellaceae bacterium]
MNIKKFIRPNIAKLEPYSTARDEYKGGDIEIFLDANESPFGAPLNRYPDPRMTSIRERLSAIKGVEPSQIFIGNGSDEAIDLVYRIFCTPGEDSVAMIAPSYGMYKVAAATNDVAVKESLLDSEDFSFSVDKFLEIVDSTTKVVFLCSPNNPSGNLLPREEVEKVIKQFEGIVVVDEAYVDFCQDYYASFATQIGEYPNLIVLQTLSKAWGLAGVRFGLALASSDIVEVMNRVKYPYNINVLTQEAVERALCDSDTLKATIAHNNKERKILEEVVLSLSYVKKLYPSDSNFVLIKVDNATDLYNYLMQNGVIIRNRNSVVLCENCVRITVGTTSENRALCDLLSKYGN